MKRNGLSRNPYGNTKKRRDALAWLAARGITQPKPMYSPVKLDDAEVEVRPARERRRIYLV